MNAATKLLDSMRRHPLDWRIEQLQNVAHRLGMEVRCVGGSHHVFSHARVAEVVSVPAHRPVKPIYVRQFVALCDKVKESEQ